MNRPHRKLFLLTLVNLLAALVAATLTLFSPGTVAGWSVLACLIAAGAAVATGKGVLKLGARGAGGDQPVSLPVNDELVTVPVIEASASLDDRRWLGVVAECVRLFDELERNRADFDAPRRELAEHVTARLRELLERAGVETIAGDKLLDETRHQLERGLTRRHIGAPIAEVVSPGFAVGPYVLRRARVRVAT
jgi:hypothetical protein